MNERQTAHRRPHGPTALGLALLTWAIGLFPLSLEAGGTRDLEDGWLIPVGSMARVLAAESGTNQESDIARGLWLSCGQSRLFGMQELPILRLALGKNWPAFRLAGSWQRLGQDLFREDQFRLHVSYGRRVQWGVSGGWDRLGTRDSTPVQTAEVETSVTAQIGHSTSARVTWPWSPAPGWHAGRGQRQWLLLVGRLQKTAWALALDRSELGVPSLQLSLLWRIAAGVGFGLRGEPATGSTGFATAWRWKHGLIRSSHIVHPDLGMTHRWSLTWGSLPGAR